MQAILKKISQPGKFKPFESLLMFYDANLRIWKVNVFIYKCFFFKEFYFLFQSKAMDPYDIQLDEICKSISDWNKASHLWVLMT